MEVTINKEVDCNLLKRRWEAMRYVENIHRMYVSSTTEIIKQNWFARFKQILGLKYQPIYTFMRRVKRKFYKK